MYNIHDLIIIDGFKGQLAGFKGQLAGFKGQAV